VNLDGHRQHADHRSRGERLLADERDHAAVSRSCFRRAEEEREMHVVWTIERAAAPGEASLPEPPSAPEPA
jgi:hypothetical protein